MSKLEAFNRIVAARTRTAHQIRHTSELLQTYLAIGGLEDDLVEIEQYGLAAEAADLAQSQAQAAGGAATLDVQQSFAALQRDYVAVMAIVEAVRGDLVRAKAPASLVAAIKKIIVNEAEVTVDIADGKRRVRRSQAQEALRAEIQKDAMALVELKAAHTALGKRGLSVKRLGQLRDDAMALAGTLGERTAKKGAAKSATQAIKDAVAGQSERWQSAYRLLRSLAQKDERVRLLLTEAARK
jgi:hypothetical protein